MNRQCILVERPAGVAQQEHFAIIETPDPAPAEGQLLIRNHFLSVEPAMRGWIADTGNYSAPVAIGEVMRSLAVGEVIASRNPDYAPGEFVTGWFGWQELAAVEPSSVVRRVMETDLPLSLSLGVLGINGITAYLALTRVGEPVAGETVVVSTAAGAVGSAAGQIAKLLGCRTIGITGTADKVVQCRTLFGYDDALNYKAGDLGAALDESYPQGIDVYFDNVGGEILDAVLPRMAIGGRVVICGTASVPQWKPWPAGPRVERHLLLRRARMQGFVIFDHMKAWDTAVTQLADWVRAGKLAYSEDMLEGIGSCPDALAGLYRGENLGKRVIRL